MIVYICVTTFNIGFKVIFVLCLWYSLSFFLSVLLVKKQLYHVQ